MTVRNPWTLAILLTGALALPARGQETPASAAAGTVISNEQIERALKPATTRGLNLRGLKRVDAQAADASVNLNIPFEYNSSELKPEASAQLSQLKAALTSNALLHDRIVVAGHTDGKGNAKYNHQLSLRRAESVKRFLAANGVDPARLETVGYGSDHLLTPDHPEDPQNRRVEIRDLGEQPSKP